MSFPFSCDVVIAISKLNVSAPAHEATSEGEGGLVVPCVWPAIHIHSHLLDCNTKNGPLSIGLQCTCSF